MEALYRFNANEVAQLIIAAWPHETPARSPAKSTTY
jgi:hypothetical protein